jgi:pyroglutamyl-peptidase
MLQGEDLRLSDDAGRYLCEFTHYTSMVEYWRKNPEGDRPVVFLHVPGQVDEVHLEKGKQVVLSLIASLAEVKT